MVFYPRLGLSLQTLHSPLYSLLSLPFRIWIQSIYHDVVYHLKIFFCRELSSRLPFLLEHPSAGSYFLLSGPASFFSSSLQFEHYTAFSHSFQHNCVFILSIHFTRTILLHIHISNASSRFCSFRRSVQVPAPYNATLRTKHYTSLFLSSVSKSPQKILLFLLKTFFAIVILCFTSWGWYWYCTQVFESVHLFDGFIFTSHIYLHWFSSDNLDLRLSYIYLHPVIPTK